MREFFRYLDDFLSPKQALDILKNNEKHRLKRREEISSSGFPAYTTQVGWLGYPDDKLRSLSHRFLGEGFNAFKVKVGADLEDDKRRLKIIREIVGYENLLMVDANQVCSVFIAIHIIAFKEMGR